MSDVTGAVCVAVYRPDRELLVRQLSSIARQTLQGWICHIVIDGHDPETASFIEEWAVGDARFVVHHHKDNVGFYRNFERALEAVGDQSAWVALADQDDAWREDKLELLVAAFDEPGTSAVVCQARVTDRDGAVLATTERRRPSPAGLYFNNQVTGSLAVFRRDVVHLALPFPTPTDAAYHDHWLGVCAQALGTIVFDDRLLQDYVQHGANVLGEERAGRFRRRLASLRSRSSGVLDAPSYLATHRWGWRVRMARELADRRPDIRPSLSMLIRGRLSIALLRELVLAVRRGELPPGRFLGLLVGALAWREGRS